MTLRCLFPAARLPISVAVLSMHRRQRFEDRPNVDGAQNTRHRSHFAEAIWMASIPQGKSIGSRNAGSGSEMAQPCPIAGHRVIGCHSGHSFVRNSTETLASKRDFADEESGRPNRHRGFGQDLILDCGAQGQRAEFVEILLYVGHAGAGPIRAEQRFVSDLF